MLNGITWLLAASLESDDFGKKEKQLCKRCGPSSVGILGKYR